MRVTENDKNAVLGLMQGSSNPQDKAQANTVLSIISKAMNGDSSANSDLAALMPSLVQGSMLRSICERMIGE